MQLSVAKLIALFDLTVLSSTLSQGQNFIKPRLISWVGDAKIFFIHCFKFHIKIFYCLICYLSATRNCLVKRCQWILMCRTTFKLWTHSCAIRTRKIPIKTIISWPPVDVRKVIVVLIQIINLFLKKHILKISSH